MILNAISGFSAKLRPREKTLHEFLDLILENFPCHLNVKKNYLFSSDLNCVEDTVRFVQTSGDNRILLVGKSLGGVRTWWSLTKYWENYKRKLKISADSRLGVVLLDPHGCQVGDGRVGSYGVGLDLLEYNKEWYRPDIRISVLYQRNKYPMGAHMMASNDRCVNIEVPGGNHWNIEDFGTKQGQFCADEIKKMIGWVNG